MILQLTNPQRGFDVLTQVENTVAGKPDEIHQVSTMIDNPWYVCAPHRRLYLLSVKRVSSGVTEIGSKTLDDLTGR